MHWRYTPTITLSAVGLFLALVVARGQEPVSYFEAFNASNVGVCVVTVESVIKDGPVQKAGILPGDVVLALDGFRIRNRSEYVEYFKSSRHGSTVQATIRRGSGLMNVSVNNIPATGVTGCNLNNEGPSIWFLLHKRWNIAPGDLLGLPEKEKEEDPTGILTETLKAFDSFSPPPHGCMTTRVECFPRRGVEALWGLGKKSSDADRLWVLGLMKVYCALVNQRYGEVETLISRHGLSKSIHDPFLDGLVVFYSRVAKRPPSLANGIPLREYGVDPIYFAFCYPFPIVPEKRTDWFAFDRDFQRDFNKATSGNPALREELTQSSRRYRVPEDAGHMNNYLGCVTAALIAWEDMGGYPFRHPDLYDEGSLRTLLTELREHLDKHPEKKVLTSFALLAPSLLGNDLLSFARSYKIISDAGTRELATANAIIDRTLDYWSRERLKFRDVQHAINSTIPTPEIYTLLSRKSPDIDKYVRNGCFNRSGQVIADVGEYCLSNPYLVAGALSAGGIEAFGGAVMSVIKTDNAATNLSLKSASIRRPKPTATEFIKLKPGLIETFTAPGDTKTTYHVFSPSIYRTNAPSPLLVLFSPSGNGRGILNAFKESADEAGWILVGCDKLRNGFEENPLEHQVEDELLDDILTRIPHVPARVFFGGFSGGAERAYHLTARRDDGVAGVFAVGGWLGLEKYYDLPYRQHMVVAMVNGNKDTSARRSVLEVSDVLQKRACVIKEFLFDGGHQLPSKTTQAEVLAWLAQASTNAIAE